jgi:hypothetical protein
MNGDDFKGILHNAPPATWIDNTGHTFGIPKVGMEYQPAPCVASARLARLCETAERLLDAVVAGVALLAVTFVVVVAGVVWYTVALLLF